MRPGDLILLLTDGVLEASAPDGPLFGVDRALAVVRACRGAAPGDIAAAVLREAHAFSGQSPVDDMTAVVVKVDGAGRVVRGQAAPDGARGLLLTAHFNGPVE